MGEDYTISGAGNIYSGNDIDHFSSTDSSSLDLLYNFSTTDSPKSAISPTIPWCGPSWKSVGQAYGHVHGVLSLIICFFGSIFNLLNLVVLTRQKMVNPTYKILMGLALADLLNEVEYISFVLFTRVLGPLPKTYGWGQYMLFHSIFSQVTFPISIFCLFFYFGLMESETCFSLRGVNSKTRLITFLVSFFEVLSYCLHLVDGDTGSMEVYNGRDALEK